jgi:four helix bundle protein
VKFGYEDLDVWNKATEFAVEVIELVENISTHRKHYRLLEQVEASSASISMNIAEGKGREGFLRKSLFNTCIYQEGLFTRQ